MFRSKGRFVFSHGLNWRGMETKRNYTNRAQPCLSSLFHSLSASDERKAMQNTTLPELTPSFTLSFWWEKGHVPRNRLSCDFENASLLKCSSCRVSMRSWRNSTVTWKRNIVSKGKTSAERSMTTNRDTCSFSKKRNKSFLSWKVFDRVRDAFVRRLNRSTHRGYTQVLGSLEVFVLCSAVNFGSHTDYQPLLCT